MKQEPSYLRCVIIVALLFTSIVPLMLFLVKAYETSFDEAWEAFDRFIIDCLD